MNPPKRSSLLQKKESLIDTLTRSLEREASTEQSDAVSVFSDNVAVRLRGLPKRERLMAQHEVENVLFRYEMGQLPQPSAHPYHDQESTFFTPDIREALTCNVFK